LLLPFLSITSFATAYAFPAARLDREGLYVRDADADAELQDLLFRDAYADADAFYDGSLYTREAGPFDDSDISSLGRRDFDYDLTARDANAEAEAQLHELLARDPRFRFPKIRLNKIFKKFGPALGRLLKEYGPKVGKTVLSMLLPRDDTGLVARAAPKKVVDQLYRHLLRLAARDEAGLHVRDAAHDAKLDKILAQL
jgi:hypothetical protein